MQAHYIYKIENTITGDIYIGESNNPKRRFWEHKSASQNPSSNAHNLLLPKAMREYGKDNFTLTILEEIPKKQRYKKEREYIKKFNATADNQYNILQGNHIREYVDHTEIIQLYKQGLSASKIGEKYNVKHPQITAILKEELGEEYYELSKKHTPTKKNIKIETIVDLIENQGKTKKETAEILGVCNSTIVRRYNNWKKQQDPNYIVNPIGLGAKKVDVELIKKAYAELKSTRKVETETGYSRSTIRKYLKKEGIL